MDSPSPGRPLNILLVEDSVDDVRIIRECFRRDKINNPLWVAEDGMVAMQMLHREGKYAGQPLPDIIFLDLNMPNKNGHETLREIKADPALCNIHVVILTSSNAETDVVKTYDLDADNYLVKPVNLEKFLEVINGIDDVTICAMVNREVEK